MGKWKQDQQFKDNVYDGDDFVFRAVTASQAERVANRHNADLEAYEARIAELQRRLDAARNAVTDDAQAACYCDFDARGKRTLLCEYCELAERVVAIAEGRNP